MKIQYVIISFAVFLIGCQVQTEETRKEKSAEGFSGCWSSVMITYPDDPIFKDTPPDTEPGSAKLLFNPDGHFIYSSKDGIQTGAFQVHGAALVLTSNEDGESFPCEFELNGPQLTLFMNDGFRFDFERIHAGSDACIPR